MLGAVSLTSTQPREKHEVSLERGREREKWREGGEMEEGGEVEAKRERKKERERWRGGRARGREKECVLLLGV